MRKAEDSDYTISTTGDCTITYNNICPGCGGSGIQERSDNGLKVICPICEGFGYWNKPTAYPWYPAYPITIYNDNIWGDGHYSFSDYGADGFKRNC